MGRVYLGRSPGGRQVAIKVIRPELAEDADFRARFGREISAARKVSGIFTASVVDADLDGPMPWLATSYIAGPSLADAVTARGPLPESIVLRLAAGLAEGLSAIHAAGVVHRDLKPSNVLLADDGPRLIDFGISRSMETSALTQTGTVVGSPGFMSPEQTQGREVGPPSDIFSLGAVLTFAATGEGPFGQGSTVALLYRVVTSQPNTAGLPGGLRLVAERCLAKDPRQRPTAAQLLAGLSEPPPVAYPPMTAHPATEDLHPVYDEQLTHTQRHWERPAAECRVSLRPAGGITRAALGQPGGSTRASQAGSQGLADRRGRGRRPGLRRGRGLRGREDRARPRRCADHLGRCRSGRFRIAGHVARGQFRLGDPGSRRGRHGGPRLLPGPERLGTVNHPIRDHGVKGCSESPSSGEATLQRAIDTRQDILNHLPTLSVSGLPNGTQLVRTLTTTMQDSIAADKDYQGWMEDFANSGNPCGSDPSQDSNYAAAVNVSNAATIAKNAFVAIWDPMAPRYGQQVVSSTGF